MRSLVKSWIVVAAALLAACGGQVTEGPDTLQLAGGTAAKDRGGELHTYCSAEAIPVWLGVGNAASATQVGTLALASGTATLTLVGGDQFPFVPTVLHLQFADSVSGIPMVNGTSGNPIPGQFACSFAITPVNGQTTYSFDLSGCPLPADANGDGKYLVAAHFGFTQYGGVEGFGFYLPPSATMSVTYPYGGGPAYFPHTFITNDGFLNGDYLGWCVDPNRVIYQNTPYTVQLYSSYDAAGLAALADLMDPPTTLSYQNLPLVNYIQNTFAAGTVTPLYDGSCNPVLDPNTGVQQTAAVTYSDIQRAIWILVNGATSGSGLYDLTPYGTSSLLCLAQANGVGFVPGCNQSIAFLMAPTGMAAQVIIGQVVLSSVAIPCTTSSGTAWADGNGGKTFPKASQWGTYFEYDPRITCVP